MPKRWSLGAYQRPRSTADEDRERAAQAQGPDVPGNVRRLRQALAELNSAPPTPNDEACANQFAM